MRDADASSDHRHGLKLFPMRAILFDLDDTLLDHGRAMRVAADEWSIAAGLPAGRQELFAQLDRDLFSAYERGEMSYLGQRAEKTRRFLNMPQLSDEEALARFADYVAACQAHCQAFDDAAPTLRRTLAAGLAVGVLTNGSHAVQEAKMHACGLDIDGVTLIATVELGTPKPDRRAYLAGCRVLGARPEDTLMVGDNFNTDVKGARAAGLQALHLNRTGGGDIVSLNELKF